MTEEQKALREAVAKAICTADEQNGGPPWDYVQTMGKHVVSGLYDRADAAIAVALERAAKVIENDCHDDMTRAEEAAAIRALIKEK